jgi:hypothetical protein
LKNENTFTKKKCYKNEGKAETIKKIKVSSLKKVLKFCDDNFFFENIFILKTFRNIIYLYINGDRGDKKLRKSCS